VGAAGRSSRCAPRAYRPLAASERRNQFERGGRRRTGIRRPPRRISRRASLKILAVYGSNIRIIAPPFEWELLDLEYLDIEKLPVELVDVKQFDVKIRTDMSNG
jgi:hypothetical protein